MKGLLLIMPLGSNIILTLNGILIHKELRVVQHGSFIGNILENYGGDILNNRPLLKYDTFLCLFIFIGISFIKFESFFFGRNDGKSFLSN